MCADLSVPTSQGNYNVRPILTRHGLTVHRSPGDAHLYTISHVHTGKAVLKGFLRLRVAFEFLRALDQVIDFESLDDAHPQLSTHQKWCLHHILGQGQRCVREGWYVPPSHFIRDWNWRNAGRAALEGEG